MMRRPPRSHRTDTLLPYTTPFRSIFFAVHYERDFTLFVTTDRDQDSPERPPAASDEEIRYLCDAANQYFAQSIGPEDVVWSYAGVRPLVDDGSGKRSEEHTSELQSLMSISYAVFCLKQKTTYRNEH